MLHGCLVMNQKTGCCAVVPGTSLPGFAVLPVAAALRPIFVTPSTAVFELCAVLPGLCSPLPCGTFALYTLVFTLCCPLGPDLKIEKSFSTGNGAALDDDRSPLSKFCKF